MRRSVPSFALLLTLASVLHAQPARRPITIDDLSRLKTVGDPQVSPDGAWVAYTVTSADVEKDRRDTDVWMTSWDGTRHVRLTSSPDNESRPRWSPDGKYLAFTASRGDEEEKKKGAQVWLLDRAGGEAQKLTDVKGGVADYAWSPDSTRLALVVNDEDPDDEPEKKEGWKRKTKPPIVLDRYQFKRDREGYQKRLYSRLALFDITARKVEVLTKGDVDDQSPAWSPDGSRLAFLSKRGHPDPDRTANHDLFVIEARAGADPTPLTTTPQSEGGRPAWSPDGKTIAVLLGEEDKWFAYDQDRLALVPSRGGDPSLLTAALDRRVGTPLWSADGRSLYCSVEDDLAAYLARVAVDGGRIEPLTSGRQVVSAESVNASDRIAVLVSSPGQPAEVHALDGGSLRKLTAQNDALVAELQLASVDRLVSKSRDGTEVHSIVTRPAGAAVGQARPALLYVHGGPNSQDDFAFSFDREYFAAAGYVVIEVNYRGSSGRGASHQKAIFADWGNKEVVDLLGAVDEAVRQGIADAGRLGIGGWSYGGILTNYTIATDARFKAAVSGAGSSLQLSMYGVDQYIVQYEQEMGLPWKSPDAWMKVSYPFFKADRIRTPTLFLCGEKDFNVPIAGSEQMYQALRSQNVPTQLVIYPGQFHSLSPPSYERDRLLRFREWWDRYLQPETPKPTPQP